MLETHGRFRFSYLEVRDARPTVGFRRGRGGGCLLALVIFYCSEFKLSLSIQFIFLKKLITKYNSSSLYYENIHFWKLHLF